ncbi:MAG: hypothetical protein N2C14_06905 [Planctomycetales bacterium]
MQTTPRDVRLIPVMEIEPWGFSDRKSPEAAAPRAEWNEYWRLCLVDAGLDHLPPISEGSLFYEISQLEEPHVLDAVVRRELASWDLDEDLSTVEKLNENGSSLYGGIAVLRGSQLVTYPGCCCCLDTIQEEWFALAASKPNEWTDVWVGHDVDSLELRFDADKSRIEFRVAKWQMSGWDREFHFAEDDLIVMLDAIRNELDWFARRLAPALPDAVPDSARESVARRMAGTLIL